MPYITTGKSRLHKNNPTLIYLIGYLFFTLLFSCRQASNPSSPNLTRLFDTTNYIFDNSPAKGIRYLDSAMAKQSNVSVADRFEYYRLHCYYHYKKTGDYQKALLYADSLETLIESTHNEKKYAKQYGIAYFSKGNIYFALNQYTEAYKYYYKGQIIGRNNFEGCTLAEYSYNMGMIMYKQEHFQLAATHFIQSFEESKNCVDNFVSYYRAQELLDNAALSYKHAGMPEHAEEYYNKALDYINSKAKNYPEKVNIIEVARGVVYGNLARIYIDRRDFAKAEIMLKKSIAINLKSRQR